MEEKLNELSTAKFGKTRSNPGVAPLASSNTQDSVLHPHSPKLTDCRCKYFIGPYKRLKGLTVKVIIYVSVQGRTRGYNRMAVYTGLTRSSCSIIMFNIIVKNMEMKRYQEKKVQYFKKEYGDEGWGRQLDFSLEGAPQKKGKGSSSKKVVYSLPDGTASMFKNIPEFPLALGTGLALQTKSKKVGHYSHVPNVPEGVDEEWLEGANFVHGARQHSLPSNHNQSKSFPSSTTNVVQTYEQTSEVTIMESDIIGGTGEGPALKVTMTRKMVCKQSPDQMEAANPGGFFSLETKSRF